jgi:hypothetical protein
LSNRLAKEASLYLRQHAENPVDWYPWGEEALDKARGEDKPILLSIGYSACHWCHVMAHESFESDKIARLMNDNFVNIKVDREERPDIDAIYMEAVQSISGSGGWPLTVFLTSEGKPFFGGTYFPPEDRQGLPGFSRVLAAVIDAYKNRRDEIDQTSSQIMATLKRNPTGDKQASLSVEFLDEAHENLKTDFDWINGGFGSVPKFPQPMTLEFLLRYYRRTRDAEALQMVTLTLEKMANGGIFDQLGGGFHRYSTDGHWTVPHFEKMLYDNAQLSRFYMQTYLVTKRPEFRRIAEETLDYVITDMASPQGGFYSTRDADSEGVEGKYYLWNFSEITQILGDKIGRQVSEYYGLTASGNQTSNILHSSRMLMAELPEVIKISRATLLSYRQKRIQPARDEKIIASWNGLMLSSLAEAASVLGRSDYLGAAVAAGTFLMCSMITGPYIRHIWNNGRSSVDGFLPDYSLVIDGFIKLHEATFEGQWLRQAIDMAEVMVESFWNDSSGMFFDTTKEHQELIVRPRVLTDNSIPSGSSSAALVLFKLSRITGREDLEKIASKSIRTVIDLCRQHPLSFSHWLCALDFYLSTPKEIAVLGRHDDKSTEEMMRVLNNIWLPNKVLVACEPPDLTLAGLPILEGKHMIDDNPTIFICERFTCRSPATNPKELKAQLAEVDL